MHGRRRPILEQCAAWCHTGLSDLAYANASPWAAESGAEGQNRVTATLSAGLIVSILCTHGSVLSAFELEKDEFESCIYEYPDS